MRDHDPDYLAARAEAETEAAARAASPEAVQAHYRMAEAYLDRLYPPEGEVGFTRSREDAKSEKG